MDIAATPSLSRPNHGVFTSAEAALSAVVQRLVIALRPREIYLFGSRARGTAPADSDFDILVVFDDDAPDSKVDYDVVYAPLSGLGIGCDVIPCRLSELEEVLSDPTNPWRTTWAGARKLYERA